MQEPASPKSRTFLHMFLHLASGSVFVSVLDGRHRTLRWASSCVRISAILERGASGGLGVLVVLGSVALPKKSQVSQRGILARPDVPPDLQGKLERAHPKPYA